MCSWHTHTQLVPSLRFARKGPGVKGRNIYLMGDAGNVATEEGGTGWKLSYSHLAPRLAGVGQRGAKPQVVGVLLGQTDSLGFHARVPLPARPGASLHRPQLGCQSQRPDVPHSPW